MSSALDDIIDCCVRSSDVVGRLCVRALHFGDDHDDVDDDDADLIHSQRAAL